MAICIYVGCPKATTNNWDIRPSVTVKVSLVIILWMAEQIYMIELALESTHQTISDNISYIIWWSVFIEIQAYQYSDIISYLLKLAWHLLWQITVPIRYKFWSCDGNSLHTNYYYFVYILLCLRIRPQT